MPDSEITGPVLAVDYGIKRVGLALGSAKTAVVPLRTVFWRTRDELFSRLLKAVAETAVRAVVVGLPLDLNDQRNLTTRQAENFARSLQRRLEIPVYLQKEGLTSDEAERLLGETGMGKRKTRRRRDQGLVDQMAAVLILKDFLQAAQTNHPRPICISCPQKDSSTT